MQAYFNAFKVLNHARVANTQRCDKILYSEISHYLHDQGIIDPDEFEDWVMMIQGIDKIWFELLIDKLNKQKEQDAKRASKAKTQPARKRPRRR